MEDKNVKQSISIEWVIIYLIVLKRKSRTQTLLTKVIETYKFNNLIIYLKLFKL